MDVGIVGTGSIGGMLTRAWSASGRVERVHICNRSKEKAALIAQTCGARVVLHDTPDSVASAVSWLVLCVKAEDARTLLPSLARRLPDDGLLLSTNSALSLLELEATLPCRTAKLIPSVTQEVGAGALLVMLGSRLTQASPTDAKIKEQLWELLGAIGSPYKIDEGALRVYSDMTSCGPAFLAQWLSTFAQAAVLHGVPFETAQHLLADMAFGVGKLCTSGYGFADITKRVAVPGGVTSAGMAVLKEAQEGVFERLLEATAKRQADIAHHGHR